MKKYMNFSKIMLVGLSAMLMVTLSSCDEWLNLKPESEIILDEFWQSEADVESVLAACYRGLTEDANVYRMIVWGELRSDNVVNGRFMRYDMQRIMEGDITATNQFVSWGSFYTIINYCNNLLYFAPEVLDRDINFSQADLDRLRAEVLTLRALSYFYLVRTFRDVPLVLEPSIDDSQDYNKPKSSEQVVLDQIIADLLVARQYARVDFGRRDYNKGRVTKAAVNAILADVYLWAQRYDECIAASDEVLSNSAYRLVDASLMLTQVFYLGNSTESIFELQFDDNIQPNNPVFNLYGNSQQEQGEFSFPATLAVDHINNLVGAFSPFIYKVSTEVVESEKDVRYLDFIRPYGGKFHVFKYAGLARQETVQGLSLYRYRNSTSNWILYRLSDVILMKAEALVQKGKANPAVAEPAFTEAVKLVNRTYLRSNPENASDSLRLANYPTPGDLEMLVLRERQRELMFEGKRWFDLVRFARREGSTGTLNTFLMYKNPGGTTSTGAPVPDAMYLPISQRELEANPKLEQNPFYKETGSSSKR